MNYYFLAAGILAAMASLGHFTHLTSNFDSLSLAS